MRRFTIIAIVAGLALAMTMLVADAQMPTKTQADSTQITNPATTPDQGQMMGSNQGQMMGSGNAGMMNWSTMMEQMSDHQQMMSGQFDSLEVRFKQMMNINDMAQLKEQMQSFMGMMNQMHQSMMSQNQMMGQAMSMMNSGNMPHQNMMGGGQ